MLLTYYVTISVIIWQFKSFFDEAIMQNLGLYCSTLSIQRLVSLQVKLWWEYIYIILNAQTKSTTYS